MNRQMHALVSMAATVAIIAIPITGARADDPGCKPVECYQKALEALKTAEATASQETTKIADLQSQIDGLKTKLADTQIGLMKSVDEVRHDGFQFMAEPKANTGVVLHFSTVYTFPFTVAQAGIWPIANVSNLAAFTAQPSGSNVIVNIYLRGTGPGGAGIIDFQVWATSK